MTQKKPDRNWKEYNKRLAPHRQMLFWGILRMVFRIHYRQLEGLAKGLGRLLSIPTPDYTTICLRLPKLKIDLNLGYEQREWEAVVIAVDATGIKVTNRGEWMRTKRKGYIKLHVAVKASGITGSDESVIMQVAS